MRTPDAGVGVATTSQLAADAAAEIAELGGNAIDCGIAAAFMAINTQPGVCALAGGAYVTIWPDQGSPVTIDGNVAIPGRNHGNAKTPSVESVTMDYGGGITTLVGPTSVAVPGTLAALELASQRFGRLSWQSLLGPTIRATRDGFPFATACHYYLTYSGESIFSRSDDGRRALYGADDSLLGPGDAIRVPYLSDTLAAIADHGADIFYRGEIAQRIVDHVQSGNGKLTLDDLSAYVPEIRKCLTVNAGPWQIATNPPPAIGGASLAAMALQFGTDTVDDWNEASKRRLLATQEAVMRYRHAELDPSDDVREPVRRMLEAAAGQALSTNAQSAATVHTSAVDSDGLACAITASSGYGSGEIPANTGLWLNNCLGELELNRAGLEAGPVGRRLPSNMAPSCCRSDGAVLSVGSPGADRITTALHQFLLHFAQRGLELDAAIAEARMHLHIAGSETALAVEPGIELAGCPYPLRRFDEPSMYFGGVAAALYDRDLGFAVAADPRREGGIFMSARHGS